MAFSKNKALALLKNASQEKRLGHAYLITGSFHDGMETIAEELACMVLPCSLLEVKMHPDVHMVEPESKSRKILTEQMRHLEEALHLKPQQSDYKVAIIHDAERMMPSAANAFLKTLEEPPDQTLLLLTTSLPEALLET
ncbi:MAG: DNA polymerase III subunit delta', partial [Verrucomicrobiota bacterium]